MNVVLGSSSKWRKEVLNSLGFQFSCLSPNIDEKSIRDSDPRKLTLKIARAKAEALLEKIESPSLLITSDQVVICNGELREKPIDEEQCRQFLRSYKDYPAECIAAVVVTNTLTRESFEGVELALVHFLEIPEETINDLIKQGDILNCSGGFVVEHMNAFLKKLDGEMETVKGLPASLTKKLLESAIQKALGKSEKKDES